MKMKKKKENRDLIQVVKERHILYQAQNEY